VFNCEEVQSALSNYIDDDVSPELRRDLERHLAECRTCQVLYDTTRKTLQIVTNTGSFEVPEGLSERLVKRMMNALSPPSSDPPES
jgi:anti-sigma factor (TIGR02949 family)